jgi:flagellar M-ring protein FliF
VSYDTSYSQTEVVKTPGEVKSVSVALLVDNSVPDQTVAALEDSIKTTIGADAADAAGNRNVSVRKVAFDTTKAAADKAAAMEAASAERMNQIFTYGVPIGLMLLMLFILARSLRRAAPAAAVRQIAGAGTPLLSGAGEASGGLDIAVGDGSLAGKNVGEALAAEPVAVYADGTPRSFDVIQEAFDANLESILQFSKSKPEIVSSLLRSWMADERK